MYIYIVYSKTYAATFLVLLVTSSCKYIIYIVAVIYGYLKLHSDSIHSTSHNEFILDNSHLKSLKTLLAAKCLTSADFMPRNLMMNILTW